MGDNSGEWSASEWHGARSGASNPDSAFREPVIPGKHEFEVMSTEDLYIGRIIGLRVDEVAMPGGVTARREVVEHLGAVAIVALDDEQNVTLVHQYRHPIGRRLWELPAGLLDTEGEDPVDAARRELVEEAGLAAGRWETLVDMAASSGCTDEAFRVFLARDLSPVDREVLDGEEADLVTGKVSLTEAVRMAVSGELINAATVGGVLAAHAVLSGVAQLRPADAPWADRPTRFARRKH